MDKHVIFIMLLLALAAFFLWLYNLYSSPSKKIARHAPFDGPFVATRRKLITALMGDYKTADRLIAHERSKAKCSWPEAADRAMQSLERDRSRTN